MIDYWRNFKASMFHFCKDMVTSLTADGIVTSMQVFNFDAFADLESLPDADLIGVSSFELQNNLELHHMSCLIGVVTLNDTNLFRLDQVIGQLYWKLRPDTSLPVYDATTGALTVGSIKIMEGTAVMPVEKTKIRPVQFVGLTAGVSQLQ